MMDYCGSHGIPYLEFVEWDDMSRNAAIAWQLRKSERCGGCGTVTSDWHNTTGPDGEPVADEVRPVFFAVDDDCPGCAARERHEKQHGDERIPGLRTAFAPNPDAVWSLHPEP